MTYLQKAIEDSIAGGYNAQDILIELLVMTAEKNLLRPDFWQCLGKYRGWGIQEIDGRFWKVGMDGKKEVGHAQMHRLIDTLWDAHKNGTPQSEAIEEYFKGISE